MQCCFCAMTNKKGRPQVSAPRGAYLSIRLSDEQKAAVNQCAADLEMSMSNFVNRAVDCVLEQIAAPKAKEPKLVAMGRFLRQRRNGR